MCVFQVEVERTISILKRQSSSSFYSMEKASFLFFLFFFPAIAQYITSFDSQQTKTLEAVQLLSNILSLLWFYKIADASSAAVAAF